MAAGGCRGGVVRETTEERKPAGRERWRSEAFINASSRVNYLTSAQRFQATPAPTAPADQAGRKYRQ